MEFLSLNEIKAGENVTHYMLLKGKRKKKNEKIQIGLNAELK